MRMMFWISVSLWMMKKSSLPFSLLGMIKSLVQIGFRPTSTKGLGV
ncbi:hypothetical protein LINPERHAP2_LOCUS338 [Linum perenne]